MPPYVTVRRFEPKIFHPNSEREGGARAAGNSGRLSAQSQLANCVRSPPVPP